MKKDKIIVCPHCGNKTPHTILFEHSFVADWYSRDGSPTENPPTSYYTVYACATCNDITIYGSHEYQSPHEEPWLVFPEDAQIDKSVPVEIRAIFQEAKRIQKISPNAFAVLIRRALEAICDDRGVASGKLVKRLETLSERNEIPSVLSEMTTVLRTLGNAGAHSTARQVTVPITWEMEKFFKALIEYVYVAPNLLKEYQKTLVDK